MLRISLPTLLIAFSLGCSHGVIDLDPSTARTGAESGDDARDTEGVATSDRSERGDDGRSEDRSDERGDDTRSEERGDDGASTCERRCRAHAVGLYESCVDAGRDEGACLRWARSEFGTCVDDHCDDGTSTSDREERDSSGRDDGVCEERCGGYARGLYESCVDAGRDEAACSRWGRSEYSACVDEHC